MINGTRDVRLAQISCRCDGLRPFQRESADEDRESLEHAPLGLSKKPVAPVEQCVQRLVPRKRGAPSLPMQAEALVQEVERCLDAISTHASTDELQRERDAVEPGANVRHQWRIGVMQLEAAVTRS